MELHSNATLQAINNYRLWHSVGGTKDSLQWSLTLILNDKIIGKYEIDENNCSVYEI